MYNLMDGWSNNNNNNIIVKYSIILLLSNENNMCISLYEGHNNIFSITTNRNR